LHSTGVTGYIGGDIFHSLYNAHRDWSYTLLVRNPERGTAVAAKYPSATLVYGDLSDSDVLSAAAADADLVIHAAHSDDPNSASALVAGLASGHSSEKPGYLIFVSGTGMLMYHDMKAERYGQPPAEGDTYDDVEGIDKVLSMPADALHHNVEMIIQGANSESVRTAVIAPAVIYGPGRGPVNGRSIQVYDLVKYTLTHGFAPIIGTGKAEWHEVHVHDLSDLIVSLGEIATLDPERAKDPELFSKRAYFFAENGPLVWGELARLAAKEAKKQGLLAEDRVEVVDFETVVKEGPVNASWAMNSKSKAIRARNLLGWKPTGRSLIDEMPDIVAGEGKRLGITPKLAADN
jgi:nucleoside-diphosphate-sugar epimerase